MSNELKMEVILSAVDRVTAPLRNIQSQVQRTSATLRTQEKELRSLNRQMSQFPTTGPLSQSQMAIKQKIEQTTAAMKKQEQAMKSLNRRQALANHGDKAMMRGTMMMAGAAAAGYVASKPIAAFAQNESAATDLKGAMMKSDGSVSADYEKIVQLSNELGNKLPGTTADFLLMNKTLKEQGISSTKILGGIGEAAAYMAVNSKMGYEETAKFMAKLSDATNIAESEMMGVADSAQKARGLGLTSDQILEGVGKISPALRLLKTEGKAALDELMPLVVMAGQVQEDVGAGSNAINKIVESGLDVKTVAKVNKDLLKKHKIKLDFTDGKGGFGGVEKMFSEIKKLKKLSDVDFLEVASTLYGNDANVKTMLTMLMNKGIEGYKEVIAKQAEQASLQQRVNAQLGTLANMWDAASGTFTNLLAHFGSLVSPDLKGIVEWLGQAADSTMKWSTANSTIVTSLMKMGGGAIGVVGGIGMMSFAWGVFTKAVAANPIKIAIGAAVASITWAVAEWNKAFGSFEEGYQRIYGLTDDPSFMDFIRNLTGVGENKLDTNLKDAKQKYEQPILDKAAKLTEKQASGAVLTKAEASVVTQANAIKATNIAADPAYYAKQHRQKLEREKLEAQAIEQKIPKSQPMPPILTIAQPLPSTSYAPAAQIQKQAVNSTQTQDSSSVKAAIESVQRLITNQAFAFSNKQIPAQANSATQIPALNKAQLPSIPAKPTVNTNIAAPQTNNITVQVKTDADPNQIASAVKAALDAVQRATQLATSTNKAILADAK